MTMWLEEAWEFALDLLKKGLPSIPLCAPRADGTCSAEWHGAPCGGPEGKQSGKRPLPSGFPKLRASSPSATELFNGFWIAFPTILMNLGIVIPDSICAIEADTPDADAEVEKLMSGAVTATRSARPGRGRAWLVRLPDDVAIASMTKLGASKAIDVRGPGAILVAPPSRHKSGYEYSWDVEPVVIATAPNALIEFLKDAWNERIGRHLAFVAAPTSSGYPSAATPSAARQPKQPDLYPPIVSVALAPWASWAFPMSTATPAANTTTTGAVRSVPLTATATPTATPPTTTRPSPRTLTPHPAPPPTPLQVLRSALRKAAEVGWTDPRNLPRGRGFESRSELVHAILSAWIAAGIDMSTAVETMISLPSGDKALEKSNPKAWLAAEYGRAYDAVLHEIEAATIVTCQWLNILPGTLDGGARTRGMLYLIPPSGTKIEHEVVVTLGDPHDGERAGDFLEAARAFEPRVPRASRMKSHWSCAKRWQGHEALVVFDDDGGVRRLLPLEARRTT